jgi:hypothetical protein
LPPVEASPESLKLVLSGTILSPNRRVARINGRTYTIGDTIEAAGKDGKLVEFVVTEIETRRVALERLGKRYELKIHSPGQPGRIELFGSVQ